MTDTFRTTTNKERLTTPVALIYMPFGSISGPLLGISLLKAALARHDVACDVHYLNLSFAGEIGVPTYNLITEIKPSLLLGDWFFTQSLYGDTWDVPHPQIQSYPESLDIEGAAQNDIKEAQLVIELVRNKAESYLNVCLSSVDWQRYQIIGFSTTLQQNIASLALAKRIKTAWPDKIIVFGGANCEGEMGIELHRQFPFIDYVCLGEGDYLFPALVERLLAGEHPQSMPGLVSRGKDGRSVAVSKRAPLVIDLDSLPFPDFDDFFQQYGENSLDLKDPLILCFETSRGCWYGEKHKCKFCSQNGSSIEFRSKTSGRVLDELTYLSHRHGTYELHAIDNILDMGYLSDLFPEIIKRDLGCPVFFQIKANLRKDQLKLLKQAGVGKVQAGIESLSTKILKLMRKGCTQLQNVQSLKWASEFGLEYTWNFLWGFPGEEYDEYNRMAEIIPAIVHLQPPLGYGAFRLQRFSPFFDDTEGSGFINVRPAPIYHAIYPFGDESIKRAAFYFEFDYADGRDPSTYTAPLGEKLEFWRDNYCPGALTAVSNNHSLVIHDQRPTADQTRIELNGIEKAVYEYCDEAHSLQAIKKHLIKLGYTPNESELRMRLDKLVEGRLMLSDEDWFLSLAVSADDLVEQMSESEVIKQALAGVISMLSDSYKDELVPQ